MRIARMLALSAILTSIVTVSAYAQGTRPAGAPTAAPTRTAPGSVAVPNSKIAFVDTEAFGDQKVGIVRFVNTLQTLKREFTQKENEMLAIRAKIQQLAKDIETLTKVPIADRAAIQGKQDEGSRLERELKYKKEEYDAAMAKRYREVVGPVSQDIGNELDAFRKQHSLTMILDITKLLPAILSASDEVDITRAFIAYYNAKHPATAAPPAPK